MKTLRNFPHSLYVVASVIFLVALSVTPLGAAAAQNERAIVSLTGEVFMDGNLNAMREPLETGIAGSRVVLLAADGSYMDETTSDSEGYYTFGNLDTATYQLQIWAPPGYVIMANGLVTVDAHEVSAPILISTSLLRGLYIPMVSR